MLEKLRTWTPSLVMLVFSLLALAILMSSFLVGVADYEIPIDNGQIDEKSVGYRFTLNWAYGYILIIPICYFFLVCAFQEVDQLAANLQAHGMLVDRQLRRKPTSAQTFNKRWNRLMRQGNRWMLVICLAAIAASGIEWWLTSGGPLLNCAEVAEEEWDWSVKHRSCVPGSEPDSEIVDPEGRSAAYRNAAFSFVAFLQQVHLIIAFGCFVLLVVQLARLLRGLRRPESALVLVPDVEDPDIRRGFGVFEPVGRYALLTAAFGYCQLYFSRVWNAFLHTPPEELEHGNIFSFVLVDIVRGFRNEKWEGLGDSLFDIGGFSYSENMVVILGYMLFGVCILALVQMLRTSALWGRDFLVQQLSQRNPNSTFRSVKVSECLDRLTPKKLNVWPLSYPRLNQLLLVGVVALLSLFFFRIGLIFVGLIIALVLRVAVSRLQATGD